MHLRHRISTARTQRDALDPRLAQADPTFEIRLSSYLEARQGFTTDEWIDLLIQTIGFNPEMFGRRSKLLQLMRLIPFVERNYNLIELGPKGTGKSHIFSEFSPHGILISGGEVTVPKLFVNNSTGGSASSDIGMSWPSTSSPAEEGIDKALVDIMKNYMANKTFSRGVETLGAEASMVFVGNTSHTVPYMLRHSDLFDELPEKYHDSAFLDRLHAYIPGWEVDIIRGEMFSAGYGFVVDYIAEILVYAHEDYSDRYQEHFTLSPDISTRDRDGVNKTFSGLMKILFPARRGDQGRDRGDPAVGDRGPQAGQGPDPPYRLDDGGSQVRLPRHGGRLAQRRHAGGRRVPRLLPPHGSKETEPDEATRSRRPAWGRQRRRGRRPGRATEPEPEPELFQGHREYQEGQRGVSYDTLLVPYLSGASQITIVDPYVRMFHQARNLMELIEGIARGKDPADEVALKLVTVENQDGPEKLQNQLEYLLQIKQSAAVLGIVFDVELVEPSDPRPLDHAPTPAGRSCSAAASTSSSACRQPVRPRHEVPEVPRTQGLRHHVSPGTKTAWRLRSAVGRQSAGRSAHKGL